MIYYKTFDNGLRLVVNKIEGLFSVSVGVLVKTGSVNEDEKNNGISHFIEHTVFKGTKKRSAFEISDFIDGIGAQINAYTSKETTCYYTKSTQEHLEDSIEVLSDIFFNSVFDKEELEKEKGVIIEEINMSEDTPEDLCFDLLAESYYGENGLGRTILGPIKNIKRFSKKDVEDYMDKYYTSDNVVISVAGNVDVEKAEELVEKYFSLFGKRTKSAPQVKTEINGKKSLFKKKKLEQSHICLCFPSVKLGDDIADALNVAVTVLGGGMSSRLFQKIREEMGLSYNVYAYPSLYCNSGVTEIYAGVNTSLRDRAFSEIIKQIEIFNKGVTEKEFSRAKEQIKSGVIMGQESTVSQMFLYGKSLLLLNEAYDFEKKIRDLNNVTIKDVNRAIKNHFDISKCAVSTVGPTGKPLNI